MSSRKSSRLSLNLWNENDVFDVDEINDNFTKLDNLANDYIVDSGTTSYWTYRKWNSGRIDMYGVSEHMTISDWLEWGTAFFKVITSPAYPIEIMDPQVLSIRPIVKPASESEVTNGLFYIASRYSPDDEPSKKVSSYLVSIRKEDIFNGEIAYYVTGRWK